MTDPSPLRAALEGAIDARDRALAVAIAMQALDDPSVAIDDLYRDLSGILITIGDAWQRGTAEVWQEHFASGVVRTIVESCVLRVEAAAPSDRTSTVVLAAPSEEYHDLGLRMLADRFTLAGWNAVFLGADLVDGGGDLVQRHGGADAVALSASTHFHRVGLREYADGLAATNPGLRVWVGGPAFAREHADWPDDMVLDPLAVPRPERG